VAQRVKAIPNPAAIARLLRLSALLVALGAGANTLAQTTAGKASKPQPPDVAQPQPRLKFAINESGAADIDAADTLERYREFSEWVSKVLRTPVVMVPVRDITALRSALAKQEYTLVLARQNDVPAEAVRDFGYQVIAIAKEPIHAWFVVPKGSALQAIADVKGREIVMPDRHANLWRVAKAMLRDNNIDMNSEKVRVMRDYAAIGWSLESRFYDVGVLSSNSAVARVWEKTGGRVIAKSRELPDAPFIASPAIPAAQVAQLRAALVGLDTGDERGQTALKKIGVSGFQGASARALLDYLAWIDGGAGHAVR